MSLSYAEKNKTNEKTVSVPSPIPHPRLTRMNRSDNTRNEVAVEQQQAPRTLLEGGCAGTITLGNGLALPNKVNMHIPFKPAVPLLNRHLRETSAPPTLAKTGNHPDVY